MSIKNNISSLQEVLNTINTLPEAGTDLPELSNEGSASDLLSGKQLIDGEGNIVTGNIPTKTSSNLTASGATVTVPAGYYASQATKSVATATQATPSVSIDSSGLITASATQTAGYVSAGTKSGTKQLTTQAAKTITPSKSSQTAVASGVYTTGAVTVAAIPSQYITTTDATASADEIMNGETAYVNGSKVTGTFTIDSELNTQDDLIAQIQAAVDSLPEANGGESGSGSGGNMVNIDVTVRKGSTVYYLDANKAVCSITGTAIKGTVFNIDAYCGVIYTNPADGTIWGLTGNYICSTDDSAGYGNHFVMFLEDGGTADTMKV